MYAGTDRPTFALVVAGREFPTARERFALRVAKQETRQNREEKEEGEIGEGRVDEVEKVSEGTSVQRGREDEERKRAGHRTG